MKKRDKNKALSEKQSLQIFIQSFFLPCLPTVKTTQKTEFTPEVCLEARKPSKFEFFFAKIINYLRIKVHLRCLTDVSIRFSIHSLYFTFTDRILINTVSSLLEVFSKIPVKSAQEKLYNEVFSLVKIVGLGLKLS